MTLPVTVCAGSVLLAVRSLATSLALCKCCIEANGPGSKGWFVLIKAAVCIKLLFKFMVVTRSYCRDINQRGEGRVTFHHSWDC